jgi:fatty acid-binding protein DegV
LAIKPVLSLVDGVLTPIERVRTWKRALARATTLISDLPEPTDIAVLHSGNLPDAEKTAAELKRTFPGANIAISYAGATISTYAGPGAIGIAALLPE